MARSRACTFSLHMEVRLSMVTTHSCGAELIARVDIMYLDANTISSVVDGGWASPERLHYSRESVLCYKGLPVTQLTGELSQRPIQCRNI